MPIAVVLLFFLPTLLVLAAYGMSSNERKGCTSKLPPGNWTWPFLGENLAFLRPYPSTTMGEFMAQRLTRYGKFFMSSLFGERTLVSGDLELNRFILQNDLRYFGPGWPSSILKIFGRHSILALVGDAHKFMRSMIIGFINTDRLSNIFLRDAERLAKMTLSSWKEKGVVSTMDESRKYSFNVMVKNIMSIEPGQQETKELQKHYEAFMKGFISIPLNLPGTAYNKALKSRSNILKILRKKIDERRNKMNDAAKELEDDILTRTLETNYSVDQICDFLLGFLFGGHETTSKVLPLVIYFLDGCPKALEQLKKEHDEIAKRKEKADYSLSWDDYKEMKFTQCVFNEALRLGNIAKYVQRRTTTDIQYKGYDIPSGMNVMVCLSAVHLDPSLFEDPENFNPWRWQTPTGLMKTNSFMAFGGGARLCPGADLARLEFAVFLHHLLQTYEWKVDQPDLPITYPYLDFPKGMRIRVQTLET